MRRHTRRLAVLGFALVLALPATGVSQGKSKEILVDVTFRNDSDDMIQGDNALGIPAHISSNYGQLFVSDGDDANHRIHVYFHAPTMPPPSPFNCKEWGGTDFTWQLAPAYDLSTPSTISIWTLNQFAYDSQHGWAPVMNPPPKKGSATEHRLDLRSDVPPGEKRYVQLLIRLRVNSTNDMYEIWMNREWPTSGGYAYGIFEIEASGSNTPAPGAAGDTFTIRPLVAGQPYPLQGLDQNEALLYVVDYADGAQDTSGPCHMGNFRLPFEMTVTRR